MSKLCQAYKIFDREVLTLYMQEGTKAIKLPQRTICSSIFTFNHCSRMHVIGLFNFSDTGYSFKLKHSPKRPLLVDYSSDPCQPCSITVLHTRGTY
jgi:hypothetical protein